MGLLDNSLVVKVDFLQCVFVMIVEPFVFKRLSCVFVVVVLYVQWREHWQ